MNGNNKNMIHDIIHASVDTFKDLHNDSKNFRENAKIMHLLQIAVQQYQLHNL